MRPYIFLGNSIAIAEIDSRMSNKFINKSDEITKIYEMVNWFENSIKSGINPIKKKYYMK